MSSSARWPWMFVNWNVAVFERSKPYVGLFSNLLAFICDVLKYFKFNIIFTYSRIVPVRQHLTDWNSLTSGIRFSPTKNRLRIHHLSGLSNFVLNHSTKLLLYLQFQMISKKLDSILSLFLQLHHNYVVINLSRSIKTKDKTKEFLLKVTQITEKIFCSLRQTGYQWFRTMYIIFNIRV